MTLDQYTEGDTCLQCRYHRENFVKHDIYWPDVTFDHYCTWHERSIRDISKAKGCRQFLLRIFPAR